MKKLRIAQWMMTATILLIVVFQCYWLTKLYNDNWKDLKRETDVLFRESVYKLQVNRFKKDTVTYNEISSDNLFGFEAMNVVVRKLRRDSSKVKDSSKATIMVAVTSSHDSLKRKNALLKERRTSLLDSIAGLTQLMRSKGDVQVKIITNRNGDSLSKPQLDSLIKKALSENRMNPNVIIRNNDIESTEQSKELRVGEIKPLRVPPSLRLKPGTTRPGTKRQLMVRKWNRGDQDSTKVFIDSHRLNDSLSIKQVDSLFKKELAKAAIFVPFTVRFDSSENIAKANPTEKELKTKPASVGIFNNYFYQASFDNPASFLLKKIAPQILLSLLLVAFTIISFVVVYRNLLFERRLANIKNDFISNITHELKTPIATVHVAIEAMRSFNALQDPVRTKEYLDISAIELQRLSLLVDKVLKISMFEKKEIEVKKEWFNLQTLVKEVLATMKLQFDKCKAVVELEVTAANTDIKADRLHITSVIYNLLDNALKYSAGSPIIHVAIAQRANAIILSVSDNGIGIGPEYHQKVFEKFFRVPSNNTHNIKGYGLGLSYVYHIVQQHDGTIEVQSEAGKGSAFTITLPQ